MLYTGPGVDDVALNPGKRHGVSMAADTAGTGFYMFGGFVFKDDRLPSEQDSTLWGPVQDLWHFDVAGRSWERLEATHPIGGRTYAPMHFLAAPASAPASASDGNDVSS